MWKCDSLSCSLYWVWTVTQSPKNYKSVTLCKYLYELSNEYYYSANVSKYYRLCKISLTWGIQYETLPHTQHPDSNGHFHPFHLLQVQFASTLFAVCFLSLILGQSCCSKYLFLCCRVLYLGTRYLYFLLTRFNKCQDFINVPMLVVKLFHERFFMALASFALLSEWF